MLFPDCPVPAADFCANGVHRYSPYVGNNGHFQRFMEQFGGPGAVAAAAAAAARFPGPAAFGAPVLSRIGQYSRYSCYCFWVACVSFLFHMNEIVSALLKTVGDRLPFNSQRDFCFDPLICTRNVRYLHRCNRRFSPLTVNRSFILQPEKLATSFLHQIHCRCRFLQTILFTA